MAKFNIKTAKPIINTINHQVLDPVRYPKVINGYEQKSRASFKFISDRIIVDLAQTMVKFKK